MPEHDPALDHSGRLGRFLNKAITELKPVEDPQPTRTINKFTELAAKVAQSQKVLGERADRLSERLDKLNEKADGAFAKHESVVDAAEKGMDDMEEALSGLIGHNGPNGSDT